MSSLDYDNKNKNYYSNVRQDLIDLVPNRNIRILEVGSGSGDTLVALKEQGIATFVVGVEKFVLDNSNQKNINIDQFIIGDLETDELNFAKESFDLILCPDILEHLHNPSLIISKLSSFLKKGGYIISSLPNIRNYRILSEIIFKGEFTYQESGIMDFTHLRFFCRKNITQLYTENNFKIVKHTSDFELRKDFSKKYLFNIITGGLFKEFFIIQNLTIAKKL